MGLHSIWRQRAVEAWGDERKSQGKDRQSNQGGKATSLEMV